MSTGIVNTKAHVEDPTEIARVSGLQDSRKERRSGEHASRQRRWVSATSTTCRTSSSATARTSWSRI